MANTIIIEKEPKARDQMISLIKELNAQHVVQTFSSAELFESAYLAISEDLNQSGLKSHLISTQLSDLQINWLTSQDFSHERPFASKHIVLSINSSNQTIQKIEPGETSIFGIPVGDLLGKPDLINQVIAEPFREMFASLVEKATPNKSRKAYLVFGSKEPWWIVHVTITKSENQIQLQLHDETQLIQPLIEEERGLRSPSGNDVQEKVKSIDLIIFRYDCLQEEVGDWVIRVRERLKTKHLWAKNPPKFLAVKYEDDGVPKSKIMHHFVSDLITLPLDRLLFLQKIEIALTLPQRITPSILYVHDVNMDVEVSKSVRIEAISDVGLAIKNPLPLAKGVLGHFYFRFPGDQVDMTSYAKVYKSESHPKDPYSYLVHFMFYGIDKNIRSRLRRYLQERADYKPLENEDPSHFEYNPQNLFVSKDEKDEKTVAVIEPDEQMAKSMNEVLTKDIHRVLPVHEKSYFQFLQKYLNEESTAPLSYAEVGELYANPLAFKINRQTKELLTNESPPKSDDEMFGHAAADIFAGGHSWLELFRGTNSEQLIDESIQVSVSGRTARLTIPATRPDSSKVKVDISLTYIRDEDAVRIELNVPSSVVIRKAENETVPLQDLRMLVIDQALVPENIESWAKYLNRQAHAMKLLPENERVKILVTYDASKSIDVSRFIKSKHIDGLASKPLDARTLCYYVSNFVQAPFTRFCFNNMGWYKTPLFAKMAKPAKIEKISEFGITLRHPSPIESGTYLFIHGNIFENAPDGNLCARSYFCESHSSATNQFSCSFLFFGINDSFLKFVRTWIKESYASQKAQD